MLVLSRKKNEVIRIGNLGTITVVRIGPHSVRLGLDFGAEIEIVRLELDEEETEEDEFVQEVEAK